MKRNIEIPDNVVVNINNYEVCIKGDLGELRRDFKDPFLKVEKKNNELIINKLSSKRKQKALTGTWIAHLNNMINGATTGFEYELRIVYLHFPMSVKVDKGKLNIQNFFGEKNIRSVSIPSDVKVSVSDNKVLVNGIDKEKVGQMSADIEKLTRISGRDRRNFQDGIFLFSRNGKRI